MSGRIVVTALVFFSLTSLRAAPPVLAQENSVPQPDTYWLSAGLGAGSEDFAENASLAYQHRAHLFSLRMAGTAGLFDDGFGSTCEARSTVVGLPLEAQLAWLPAEFLGIGLYASPTSTASGRSPA
jgi:hypothetical protein